MWLVQDMLWALAVFFTLLAMLGLGGSRRRVIRLGVRLRTIRLPVRLRTARPPRRLRNVRLGALRLGQRASTVAALGVLAVAFAMAARSLPT
jgi:hypothetical protein